MHIPTVDDVLAPYRQYPTEIQKAILLVETNPAFSILTRGYRKVLKALISRASKINGEKPIRARLDIVAEQADVDYKTVQRAMSFLRKLGWLADASGGRSEHGVFTTKQYRFSPSLCELVDLPAGNEPAAGEASAKIAARAGAEGVLPREAKMSDGPVYKDLTLKKITDEISLKNLKSKPVVLPEELRAIADRGVKPTGVCKLRGLASRAGHRLEHVWRVAQDRVQALALSGSRLYRYLETMIAQHSDYAGRASQVQRCRQETEAAMASLDRRKQYAHKRYAIGGGRIVRIFDGIAEVIQDGAFLAAIAGRDMERVYDEIEKGTWREIVQ